MLVSEYYSELGELNLTPELNEKFHGAGTKVVTYTWTNYGERNLQETLAEIDREMSAGADGVFIDEVSNLRTSAEYQYYSAIYKYVKDSYGPEKIVIMNLGSYKVTERVMSVSDIVSLESK